MAPCFVVFFICFSVCFLFLLSFCLPFTFSFLLMIVFLSHCLTCILTFNICKTLLQIATLPGSDQVVTIKAIGFTAQKNSAGFEPQASRLQVIQANHSAKGTSPLPRWLGTGSIRGIVTGASTGTQQQIETGQNERH